jgi:hypothetical protein
LTQICKKVAGNCTAFFTGEYQSANKYSAIRSVLEYPEEFTSPSTNWSTILEACDGDETGNT